MRLVKNVIKISKIIDDCFLYFVQTPEHIPFSIKRVYYILESNPQFARGHHAHKKTDQVLFCIQGSIKLILNDGRKRRKILLDNPSQGVLINRMIWHEMNDFKLNTILLVLASRIFEPDDYIRDYNQFLKLAHEKKKKGSKI